MTKQSQEERLIDYMGEGHKVDGLKAWQELGIRSLRSRISDIGRHIQVKRRYKTVSNRFGDSCRVMEYWF